ncbi:MAG: pseudouridine synthase, partial [Steroidobacteraceae bacterium]|nr:pseudouridine synthase [Steroidobacteraceae bacterium]
PTVFDRLPPPRTGRWVVVGRLDVNTSGLLLFSNDGGLAHRLMHPSSGVEREYRVRVRGHVGEAALARLRSGVMLADGPARFERVTPLGRSASHSWFRVVLREGRNREVRRLFAAVGHQVSRLQRLRYANIVLPADLPPGRCRAATAREAAALRKALIRGGQR